MGFKLKHLLYILVLEAIFINPSFAQIKLPDIFCDHMVLQQQMPIPVWGSASKNAVLQLSLNDKRLATKADHLGNWKVTLPGMKAGGPYELVIQSEDETIRIKDVYIGEVWLCSGQSNMEWALQQTAEGEREIPKSDLSLIRLFQLKKKHDTYKSAYTTDELKAFTEGHFFHQPKWELCTPETAAAFSGVAYFFGKALHESLHVPVGLIQAAVGGSPAQSWISKEALAGHPQLKHLVDEGKSWLDSPIIHPWLAVRAKENWADWKETGSTSLPGHPFSPHYLFDTAIRPLAPYPIKGVIWYQGESNATHPQSYPAMFEMLLKSWRSLWGQGDLPFYFVQLPRIGNRSRWPEFRQAQQEGLAHPNTGMVVTIDQGHPSDVHPREKAIIGRRLARLALARTYNQDIAAESPMLSSYDWLPEEHRIVLRFDHCYEGLKVRDGSIAKGIFLQGYIKQGTLETIIPPAKVLIGKDKITLTYTGDFLPTKVKYAWTPFPYNKLVNSAGLPPAPFVVELTGNN